MIVFGEKGAVLKTFTKIKKNLLSYVMEGFLLFSSMSRVIIAS